MDNGQLLRDAIKRARQDIADREQDLDRAAQVVVAREKLRATQDHLEQLLQQERIFNARNN